MRKDKVSVSTVQHEASIHEVEKSIYGVGAKPRIGTRPSEPEKAPRSSSRSPSLPPAPRSFLRRLPQKTIDLQTSSGFSVKISQRTKSEAVSFEKTIAQRSITAAGRAKKSYYGIDIHRLMDEATTQRQLDEAEAEVRAQKESTAASEHPPSNRAPSGQTAAPTQMWTEKYRAKKFTELVGDERTHRAVLRWLKAWDSLVFPGSAKPKPKRIYEDKERDQEKAHRKILLLTGPPGLGKTTLAHVCAKQAGYEVLEINASDDRSRDVVRGRIKDALGTETVRGIQEPGKPRRAGRPVCVVVDEVDGAVAGSSGNAGEGGFIKALIDLVQLDQRNSSASTNQEAGSKHRNKNGDKFKLLRPLILVCNDVYAPALRPLRSASVAEIVHVRKPPIEKVVTRLKQVFEKERIPCDHDAVRRLCESSWGLGTRKQNGLVSRGSGEGDIRGVLVQGEWIAHKLRASPDGRLTRKWLEPQLGDTHSTAVQKGLGRGGVREVVERIFLDGAGLPDLPTTLSADEERLLAESKTTPTGVSDVRKRAAITALREMIDTCGDYDRLMTDCFATYPTQAYQDDVQLSKPNACYDWLYFHDCLSRRIFSGQEWELNPYLSTSACGFHHLFAAVRKDSLGWNEEKKEEDDEEAGSQHPFSGVKADFAAREAEKHSRTILTELQSTFSANLLRLFNSVDVMATELIPSVGRILSPHVKPVVIGGSGGSGSIASVRKETEKTCIRNAVRVMAALNIAFEKVRVEIEGGSALLNGGYAYRMEPYVFWPGTRKGAY